MVPETGLWTGASRMLHVVRGVDPRRTYVWPYIRLAGGEWKVPADADRMAGHKGFLGKAKDGLSTKYVWPYILRVPGQRSGQCDPSQTVGHPLDKVPVSTNVLTVDGGCKRRKEPNCGQFRIGTDVEPGGRVLRIATNSGSSATHTGHMYGHTYVRSAPRTTWRRHGQVRNSASSLIELTGSTVVSNPWTVQPTQGRRCRVLNDKRPDAVPQGPQTHRSEGDPRSTYVWPYIQRSPDW